MSCNYDITEKPAVRSDFVGSSCLNNGRRRFFFFNMMLVSGNHVKQIEKNYNDSRNLGSKCKIKLNINKGGEKKNFTTVAF